MALLPNLVHRAFHAGELAPALAARADLARYTQAARTVRNFLVQRQGGVANRPGFGFCGEVRDSADVTLLYKWVFTAAGESTLIEAGDQYFRFWQNGAPITVAGVAAWSNVTAYVIGDLVRYGGVAYYAVAANTNQQPPNPTYWHPLVDDIYEIPTPYTSGSFNSPGRPRFTQNGATITITHTGFATRELVRITDTHWELRLATFAPAIAAPANPLATPGAAGALNPVYVITAIEATTREESLPSDPVTCASADTPTETAPNVIAWDAVAGAAEYRVYCDPYGNNTFGYLGTATGVASFNDVGFAPDFAQTPPIARAIFDSATNYPELCAHYQQRRLFGYTDVSPATVWGSRTGHLNNFSTRSPLQDDDAIAFTLSSREMNVVRHLVALKRLVLLTDSGLWLVQGDSDGVLRPTAINLDQHGYVGAARVVPTVVGNAIVFVQARGSIVRDVVFDTQVTSALKDRDLTLYAGHLFDGYTVVAMDYQLVPHSIVWCVRSDGTLLGLTYIRDDDTWGWHRHDMANGAFEDVCVVPEDEEDVVYAIVNRDVDGTTIRSIERLTPRAQDALEDYVFLDGAVSYDGLATTAIDGLDHLEGETVYAFADGVVRGPFTVTAGAITLPVAASVVHAGLPITAQLEPCDLDVHGSGVRDKRKRIQSVTFLVDDSVGGFFVGPDTAHLLRQRRESWQPATGILSGQFEITITAAFTQEGRFVLQHTEPTPLTVLGWIPRFEVGG